MKHVHACYYQCFAVLALECPAFSAENSLTSVLSRVVGGMAVSACAEGFGFEDGASVHSTSCLASAEWREPTAHCQRKPAQPQAYCIAAMPLLALYYRDFMLSKHHVLWTVSTPFRMSMWLCDVFVLHYISMLQKRSVHQRLTSKMVSVMSHYGGER